MSTDEKQPGELYQNRSKTRVDTRSIMTIIYEKALQGATPEYFAITSCEGWHTIHWPNHPHLSAIQFNDGTIVYVAETANQVVAEEIGRAQHNGGERELKVTMAGGEELTPEDFKPSPEEEEEARRDAEKMAALLAERRAKREE